MADIICECCDLCDQPMMVRNQTFTKKDMKGGKNGFCYELGHSTGGWGYRKDFGKFSGEICDKCFKAASDASNLFISTIGKLRDSEGRQSNSVSSMRGIEPPSQRRIGTLLRKMR